MTFVEDHHNECIDINVQDEPVISQLPTTVQTSEGNIQTVTSFPHTCHKPSQDNRGADIVFEGMEDGAEDRLEDFDDDNWSPPFYMQINPKIIAA